MDYSILVQKTLRLGRVRLFFAGVFLNFVELVVKLAADLGEHNFGFESSAIAALTNDAFDVASDDKHSTSAARGHAAVNGGTFDGNADDGRLENGILFSVDSADTVLAYRTVRVNGLAQVVANSRIVTVRQTRR